MFGSLRKRLGNSALRILNANVSGPQIVVALLGAGRTGGGGAAAIIVD